MVLVSVISIHDNIVVNWTMHNFDNYGPFYLTYPNLHHCSVYYTGVKISLINTVKIIYPDYF